ncbi:MAG: hypothetical protein WKF80_10260 [Thermomicrobiales bacterium]
MTIPMVPDSVLLPNAQRRLKHYVWGPHAKSLRAVTYQYAREVVPGGEVWAGPVRLLCVIAWPKPRRRCDFQAACHALKGLVDGLADAGWMVDDDQVVGMDIEQVKADPDDRAGWVRVSMAEAV